MMKVVTKLFLIVFSSVFLFYLLLPAPPFPSMSPDSLQSQEPGDTEDVSTRRAYFTDATRAEVLEHYQRQWSSLSFGPLKIPVPTYRLSYPPEEAWTLIRDQTRSTHLEEIVHPFRESFFINEFMPTEEKDKIIIDDREFQQKITVRYVRSSPLVRVVIAGISLGLLFVLTREWWKSFKKD